MLTEAEERALAAESVSMERNAALGKIVYGALGLLSPCGHFLEDARNVGTPNWQNKWRCQTCGYEWSR